ncbi:hypothetical protein NT6N_20160 [Oceaniferula spumae]|uniref:Ice-binding protein C-terminal domain-containing protein n=1 Tax=Oceaniferula spumae TaxID=2979115 RepID=A0AAT9FM30_9BACT
MKTTILLITALSALTGLSQAATIIAVSATSSNDANNGTSFGAGGITALTNDPFAYNPLDPTSTSPDRATPTGGIATVFHGNHTNGQDITIEFTLASTYSVTALEPTIVVDLWGRNHSASDLDRDNDITVELFNGLTSLGIFPSFALPSAAPQYGRATFNLAPGTEITRFVITGGDTDGQGAGNYFTLAEVEMAAVPEPSSTALLGLGGLALILRRRK